MSKSSEPMAWEKAPARQSRADFFRQLLADEERCLKEKKARRKGVLEDVYAVITDFDHAIRSDLLHAAMCSALGHTHRTHWRDEDQQYCYEQLALLLKG